MLNQIRQSSQEKIMDTIIKGKTNFTNWAETMPPLFDKSNVHLLDLLISHHMRETTVPVNKCLYAILNKLHHRRCEIKGLRITDLPISFHTKIAGAHFENTTASAIRPE